MPDRLSGEDGRHIIRNRRKGVPASRMARDLDVSPRHVRRLWAGYRKTGDARVGMGRPGDCATEARIRPVADAYGERPVGAVRIARALRMNHDTSYGLAWSLDAYIDYYNERRLHFSLDVGNHGTPLMAFGNRGRPKRSGKMTHNGWGRMHMSSEPTFRILQDVCGRSPNGRS